MAKIQMPRDCGNAPRKLFLMDFNKAFANGDLDFFQELIPDKITWDVVGRQPITDKESFLKTVKSFKLWKVKELIVETIITHGYEASVSGQVTTKDKSTYKFCHIYRFNKASGVTITSLTTFVMEQLN
jgi:hypothetical protein